MKKEVDEMLKPWGRIFKAGMLIAIAAVVGVIGLVVWLVL